MEAQSVIKCSKERVLPKGQMLYSATNYKENNKDPIKRAEIKITQKGEEL